MSLPLSEMSLEEALRSYSSVKGHRTRVEREIGKLLFFIYFIHISFFMSCRDVQELGGGVVFPCGSISALVVPARHVR